MGRWWFIRHGQSEANAGDWLAGHRDVALTAQGQREAIGLRPAMSTLRPQRIVASDLQRAWRTADLAWVPPAPIIERYAALRERHLGAWEGASIPVLRERGAMPTLLTWTDAPPGGESQRALAARVIGWLAAHDDGRDTLAFLHGGLIRVVVGLLDDTPPHAIGAWRVANVEITPRDVPQGRWRRLLEESL
jgi:broad specificity phosphatase PhoE